MKVFEDFGYIAPKKATKVIFAASADEEVKLFTLTTKINGDLVRVNVTKEDGVLNIEVIDIADENV